MQNNTETVLNILMSDKTIAETLNKIISGQYVTDKERKDGMKAVIDRWSELTQSQVPEQNKNVVKAQAEAIKLWIENLKEVNY